MKTMDTMCTSHKKYRPPLTPTSFYQQDIYSRHSIYRPQSEYRFAGGGTLASHHTLSSSSRKSKICSACLAMAALIAALAVLAVAALAFYMGALRPDSTDPIISFDCTMRVIRGDVYGGAPGGAAWRERARRYTASLKQIFSNLPPLRDAFIATYVTGFGDGRLDVYFRLYLDRRKIPNTIANVEERIKNILLADMSSKTPSFGQIKIDPNSVLIKRDLEHTYKTEADVRDEINESINAAHTGNSSQKQNDRRMGVIRKTTIKPTLQPTKIKPLKNPGEPDIDIENLPVIQGSFQISKTDADITENKNEKATTKPPVTTKVTTRSPFTTTLKPKQFTIMSTLNVKQKQEISTKPPEKKQTNISIVTAVPETSSTNLPSSTNKVSQMLLDLLTKENQYKDIPNIDSLFTVPHVVDDEPWRPITQPEIPIVITPPSTSTMAPPNEYLFQDNAEDRMGVAEVVEDISTLEGVLNDFVNNSTVDKTEQSSKIEEAEVHNVNKDLAADIYVPKPVYTSFSNPTYSATFNNTEKLGSHFPKPHPIPIDIISSAFSEEQHENKFDIDGKIVVDDGKPIMKPPKDRVFQVAINVLNNKDLEAIGLTTPKIESETKIEMKDSEGETTSPENLTTTEEIKNNISSVLPEIVSVTTYRPKADFITQATIIPHNTWEFVNSSSKEHRNFNKRIPEKHYNQTLQAVITKDDTEFVNTTPRFSAGLSLLRNLTDIIHKLTSSNNEEKRVHRAESTTTPKVVETSTTVTPIITLLPAKSNLGINRPLRPRPKNPLNNTDKENKFDVLDEGENKQANDYFPLETREGVGDDIEIPPKDEIDIIPSNINISAMFPDTIPISSEKPSVDTNNNITDGLRLPKTDSLFRENEAHFNHSNESFRVDNEKKVIVLPTATEFFLTHPSTQAVALTEKVKSLVEEVKNNPLDVNITQEQTDIISNNTINKGKNDLRNITKDLHNATIPNGTYRVSYHVSGSVSTKVSNKTKSLESYDLPVEQDIVLEFPKNYSQTLTPEKLKQLANLATLSDFSNRNYSETVEQPEPLISTKAVSSSYTLNHGGFKILTKTYNKLQSTLDNMKLDKLFEIPNNVEDFQSGNGSSNSEYCNDLTSFRCNSGQCLPSTSRCNKLIECADGEDEVTCSCADYLRAEYLLNKICDGIVDCWDFSDESSCGWCSGTDYVCSNAKLCISQDKVCDGTQDCPYGDDEKTCVTIADKIDNNAVVPFNDEGYLMIRKRGVWGRFCVDNYEKIIRVSRSSLQLVDLGRAVCRAMTFESIEGVNEVYEKGFSPKAKYWELGYNEKPSPSESKLTFRPAICPHKNVLRVRCSNLDCGIKPFHDAQQPRIVGGTGAISGAWPWQAALYRDGEFQCGATLIADDWLLSAGHCFHEAEKAYWVARVGALRRGPSPRGPYEASARVLRVIIHPQYAAAGFRNDLALLHVPKLALHSRVRPVCLPQPRLEPSHGTLCTVVGWGQLHELGRIFPDTLQEVELPVISTEECKRRTLSLHLYRVTDDMFCAGYDRGGRDACLGDSGGPLMCQEEDNRWYIYGVTSNGYGCARASRPGVYIKVSHYIDWIDSVIEQYRNEDNDLIQEAKYGNYSRLNDDCKGHRCPLGECLPASSVCNGFIECTDGTDEMFCNT